MKHLIKTKLTVTAFTILIALNASAFDSYPIPPAFEGFDQYSKLQVEPKPKPFTGIIGGSDYPAPGVPFDPKLKVGPDYPVSPGDPFDPKLGVGPKTGGENALCIGVSALCIGVHF